MASVDLLHGLVPGGIYRNGSTFYRIATVRSPTSVDVERLAVVHLPPSERSTPTHSYYRVRLVQPVVAAETLLRARWTAKSGWGVSARRGLHRHGIGRIVADLNEEYESYTYAD